jgi:competence protein ComEA
MEAAMPARAKLACALWSALAVSCLERTPTLGPPVAVLAAQAASPALAAELTTPPLPLPPPSTTAESEAPIGPKPRSAPARPQARRSSKASVVGVLNVNRATEAELRLLPGIGKTRAATIVERRRQRPFASLDELARIRGLKSIVRRLRAHLALSGDSTLRPAPAPPKEKPRGSSD